MPPRLPSPEASLRRPAFPPDSGLCRLRPGRALPRGGLPGKGGGLGAPHPPVPVPIEMEGCREGVPIIRSTSPPIHSKTLVIPVPKASPAEGLDTSLLSNPHPPPATQAERLFILGEEKPGGRGNPRTCTFPPARGWGFKGLDLNPRMRRGEGEQGPPSLHHYPRFRTQRG